MPSMIPHDPDARLPYRWDWGAADLMGKTWLDGDTITAATVVSSDPSVTVSQVTHTDTTVTAWAEGGTEGKAVDLTCHITTAGGRQDDRTMTLSVQER